VVEATHGTTIAANHVYVIAPDSDMAVANRVLHLTKRRELPKPHLPVDFLFRSLATLEEPRAIGVVLSGTGSDGALGLREIKGVGGITFAQSEESAKHPGMPHSAIETGAVDFVLPPEAIARRLADLVHHPY